MRTLQMFCLTCCFVAAPACQSAEPQDLPEDDASLSDVEIAPQPDQLGDLSALDASRPSDVISIDTNDETKEEQDGTTPDDASQEPDLGTNEVSADVDEVDNVAPKDGTSPDANPIPCEDVVCPDNATCVEGDCVCDDGYEPAMDGSCVDLDECAAGLDNCDPAAECLNLTGSYECGPCPPTTDDVKGDGTLCKHKYNACGLGRFSPKAAGTFDNPLVAPYLPMVDKNDTSAAASDVIDTYDCAPDKLETGPEVFYRFVTEHPGDFHAELVDAEGIDIDIHLLQGPKVEGTLMTGCIARAHEVLTVEELPAGEYWVVADTWASGGVEYQGAYTLAFEWTSIGVWNEVPVDEGITWSRFRLMSPFTDQTINRVEIDLTKGWDIQPHEHAGCSTVASNALELGALVGVNGSFYGANCKSLSLLRADGVTTSTNEFTGYAQRTIGWTPGVTPTFSWLEPQVDWVEVSDALGGYPSLVTDGVGLAEALPGSEVWSDTDWTNNPRTVVGVDDEGDLVLLTVDGRTAAGDGMTTPVLATFLANLGIVDAINLDGGGSTSMTVHDCWVNHVVSYPSDNKNADHYGGRKVGNGFYVR